MFLRPPLGAGHWARQWEPQEERWSRRALGVGSRHWTPNCGTALTREPRQAAPAAAASRRSSRRSSRRGCWDYSPRPQPGGSDSGRVPMATGGGAAGRGGRRGRGHNGLGGRAAGGPGGGSAAGGGRRGLGGGPGCRGPGVPAPGLQTSRESAALRGAGNPPGLQSPASPLTLVLAPHRAGLAQRMGDPRAGCSAGLGLSRARGRGLGRAADRQSQDARIVLAEARAESLPKVNRSKFYMCGLGRVSYLACASVSLRLKWRIWEPTKSIYSSVRSGQIFLPCPHSSPLRSAHNSSLC